MKRIKNETTKIKFKIQETERNIKLTEVGFSR